MIIQICGKVVYACCLINIYHLFNEKPYFALSCSIDYVTVTVSVFCVCLINEFSFIKP
jgi:hypothetical protein